MPCRLAKPQGKFRPLSDPDTFLQTLLELERAAESVAWPNALDRMNACALASLICSKIEGGKTP